MITIHAIWIPIIFSALFIGIMIRPGGLGGDYNFGIIFRLFWFLPICVTWIIYLAVT